MVGVLMADGHIPVASLAASELATAELAASELATAPAVGGVGLGAATGHSHGLGFLDRLGVGVSLGCAIHCIAAGVVSALPSAALGFEGAGFDGELLELLEWPFLIGAGVIGLSALIPAFRDHGSRVPLSIFAAGIALLAISRLVPSSAEIVVTVPGVIAIASAHLVNLRLCHPRLVTRA